LRKSHNVKKLFIGEIFPFSNVPVRSDHHMTRIIRIIVHDNEGMLTPVKD